MPRWRCLLLHAWPSLHLHHRCLWLWRVVQPALCEALLCRLRLRKALLNLHVNMAKKEARGLAAAEKFGLKALEELKALQAACHR